MAETNRLTPLVSFCMSTYKRQVFLKEQLNTILKQTVTDFEIVVCDNDPEGSAAAVVQANGDARIKYFANTENLGMIKSFNRCIQLSSGAYIVMITDDDPIYPDMLETLFRLEKEYPGYGMYLGGCDWFCTHHEVARLYGLKVGTNSFLSNEHDLNYVAALKPAQFVENVFTFKIFHHYLWSTGMVKKEVLTEMGGVPDYGTPFLGDYAFIALMGSYSGCVIVNKSLGCQTLHDQNFGRKQNEQLITAVKSFIPYLDTKLLALKEWPELRPVVESFVGIWVTAHLTFLHQYPAENDGSLAIAEREIFAVDFMRQFKIKYFIKRNFPKLHDWLVGIKKQISK